MATWKCPQEWSGWVDWLALGLHGRCRWRLPVLLLGILFAQGRRSVASWLRAAGIQADFSGCYYFVAAIVEEILEAFADKRFATGWCSG